MIIEKRIQFYCLLKRANLREANLKTFKRKGIKKTLTINSVLVIDHLTNNNDADDDNLLHESITLKTVFFFFDD